LLETYSHSAIEIAQPLERTYRDVWNAIAKGFMTISKKVIHVVSATTYKATKQNIMGWTSYAYIQSINLI
jgi:hypothetical protein